MVSRSGLCRGRCWVFTDSYDIFAVGLLTTMLGVVYWPRKGSTPTNSDTAIKVATSGGTVVGQFGFGILADIVGRKRMYGLELVIIIFATLAQALTASSPSFGIVGVIIFWRIIMGIGKSLPILLDEVELEAMN
jgi:PHS family inorganic phosphate transporter-like MFS transporter